MSNTTIFERMREACDHWDAGAVDCLELGLQLVGLAEALEGVPRRIVDDAREWRLALEIASDPAAFGERDLAIAQLIAEVARIRPWIDAVQACEPGDVLLSSMARREFQFPQVGSGRFWAIDVEETILTVQFGRTGMAGRSQTKHFGSAAEAIKAANKLVTGKLNKGYQEVVAHKPAPANPVRAAGP